MAHLPGEPNCTGHITITHQMFVQVIQTACDVTIFPESQYSNYSASEAPEEKILGKQRLILLFKRVNFLKKHRFIFIFLLSLSLEPRIREKSMLTILGKL